MQNHILPKRSTSNGQMLSCSLQKCVYSVTRNDKVNNCCQESHSITPRIEFEHIKGKENILADSLSRLRYLGLHEDNGPEELGYEYGRSILNMD